jgi:hypothetical protein
MLLRISLIVAILAGLGAGGLGYYEATNQIPTLTKQRDDENTAKHAALTELATTKTKLKKTESDLATTTQELTDTQGERDKAVARADAQSKRADELSDKLATAIQDRDNAQNDLAPYKATNLKPEEIITLNKSLKEANMKIAVIEGEKAAIGRELARTQAKLESIIGIDPTIKLRADLVGKVVVVDPKWDFVVLDIGDEQGVIQDGEMLVSRDGKLVAKVVVRSVQKDRCIANIVPGWKLGEMIEGDEVTPAHPAS